MINIDWVNFIRENGWFGWVYFGPESDGNPFARDNLIYWQYYKEDGIKQWIIKATRLK